MTPRGECFIEFGLCLTKCRDGDYPEHLNDSMCIWLCEDEVGICLERVDLTSS